MNWISIKQNKLINYLISNSFYIAFISMLINLSINNINILCPYLNMFTAIALLFFGLKIMTTRYNLKEIIIFLILGILSIIIYKNTTDNRMIWLVIVLLAAKNINFRKIAYLFLITLCIIFILTLTLYFSGLIKEIMTEKGGHSWGFIHPNTLHFYFLLILSVFIFLNFYHLKLKHYILLFILNLIFYFTTLSRSAFLTATLTLIYPILVNTRFFNKHHKKVNKYFISLLLFTSIIISILPCFFSLSNNFMVALDNILTGRLSQANFYYSYFGLSLLGKYMSPLFESSPRWYLDMGFSKLLIQQGLFSYICIISSYFFILKSFYKKNKISHIYLTSVFMIHLLTENVTTFVFFNLSFLWFSSLIYNEKNFSFKILKEKLINFCKHRRIL